MTIKELKTIFTLCPEAIDDLTRKEKRQLKNFLDDKDFTEASRLIIHSKNKRDVERRDEKINKLLEDKS